MAQQHITVIPGDGIGPSVIESVIQVLTKLNCGFEFDYADAGQTAFKKTGNILPQRTLDLIEKNRVVIKGPLATPVGCGHTSINVTLRKHFKLYANQRPAISFPGTRSRFQNIDIVTIRENTEGLYSGINQFISDDGETAQVTSQITRAGCEKIVRFAFEFARKENRKRVTIVHKANILKSTSGLFLKTAQAVAAEYPDIQSNELIIDHTCMHLVMQPEIFDVIVTTNLFGDIISDLCAGLVGGLGLASGANLGNDCAIFETLHGSAPDLTGKDLANPTSAMLAGAQMLDYLGLKDKSARLRNAIRETLKKGDSLTRDLGGVSGTKDFT
uniref:isocitrate dehydrogenase n=1 Tax=Gayadomonas joobiniege TaxID=1234606 RepID=UPI0003651BF1